MKANLKGLKVRDVIEEKSLGSGNEQDDREAFCQIVNMGIDYAFSLVKSTQDKNRISDISLAAFEEIFLGMLSAMQKLIQDAACSNSDGDPHHSSEDLLISTMEEVLKSKKRLIFGNSADENWCEIKKIMSQLGQEKMVLDSLKSIKKTFKDKLEKKEEKKKIRSQIIGHHVLNMKDSMIEIEKIVKLSKKNHTNESKLQEDLVNMIARVPGLSCLTLNVSSIYTNYTPTDQDDASVEVERIRLDCSIGEEQFDDLLAFEKRLESLSFYDLVAKTIREIKGFFINFHSEGIKEIENGLTNIDESESLEDKAYHQFECLWECFDTAASFKETQLGDPTQKRFFRSFLVISKVLLKKSMEIKKGPPTPPTSMIDQIQSHLDNHVKDKLKFDEFIKYYLKFIRSMRRMLIESSLSEKNRRLHYESASFVFRLMAKKRLFATPVSIPFYNSEALEWASEVSRAIVYLLSKRLIEISTGLVQKFESEMETKSLDDEPKLKPTPSSEKLFERELQTCIKELKKIIKKAKETIIKDFDLNWVAEKSSTRLFALRKLEVFSGLEPRHFSGEKSVGFLLKLSLFLYKLIELHLRLDLALDSSDERVQFEWSEIGDIFECLMTNIDLILKEVREVIASDKSSQPFGMEIQIANTQPASKTKQETVATQKIRPNGVALLDASEKDIHKDEGNPNRFMESIRWDEAEHIQEVFLSDPIETTKSGPPSSKDNVDSPKKVNIGSQ